MPVHDWSRVESGLFHPFHTRWIVYLTDAINEGLLPAGYFADCEMETRRKRRDRSRNRPDVLTLKSSADLFSPVADMEGAVALAEAAPQARRVPFAFTPRPRRHVVIRTNRGRQVVAFIEIMSPGNKDRVAHLDAFAAKVAKALDDGIHVLVVDPFPPGRHDPNGIHEVIQQRFAPDRYDLPAGAPLTLASYVGGPGEEAFVNHVTIGEALPPMPLFLTEEKYVNVPLEESYQLAWKRTPLEWRREVEGPGAAP